MAKTLDELNNHIEEFIREHHTTVDDEMLFVGSWALVSNYGDLDQGLANRYVVNVYPTAQPVHSAKGLLNQGLHTIEVSRKA